MTPAEFMRSRMGQPVPAWPCAAFVAGWIEHKTGRDPFAVYGRDLTDADAWLQEPGGIAVAVNRVFRVNGYRKTREPIIGDVGLIVPDGFRLCAAVFVGPHWLTQTETGWVGTAFAWKAWRVPGGGTAS